MRYIVFGFILFLPLIVYFTWAYIVTRRDKETGGNWNDGPITRLFVVGLVLMAGALVVSRFMNTGEEPTRIVPEHYTDDRFIRQPDGEDTPRSGPRAGGGPPPSPGSDAERLLAEDQAFLERARTILTGFISSGDIELVETLVTKTEAWGPVLRADFRRRVEGRSQPMERIVIWEGDSGIHMELPDPVGLAPLRSFASGLSFPLDSLPDFDGERDFDAETPNVPPAD